MSKYYYKTLQKKKINRPVLHSCFVLCNRLTDQSSTDQMKQERKRDCNKLLTNITWSNHMAMNAFVIADAFFSLAEKKIPLR